GAHGGRVCGRAVRTGKCRGSSPGSGRAGRGPDEETAPRVLGDRPPRAVSPSRLRRDDPRAGVEREKKCARAPSPDARRSSFSARRRAPPVFGVLPGTTPHFGTPLDRPPPRGPPAPRPPGPARAATLYASVGPPAGRAADPKASTST